MLHLVFQSHLTTVEIERIGAGDAVVLMNAGIYQGLRCRADSERFSILLKKSHVYVLADFLQAMGIAEDALVSGVNVIDFTALVDLTIKFPVIQSWR